MSDFIEVVLIGGPRECEGVRHRVKKNTTSFYVPYLPGRRADMPLAAVAGSGRREVMTAAHYAVEIIRFDFVEIPVGVSVELKIGEAGARLVEFYGKMLP